MIRRLARFVLCLATGIAAALACDLAGVGRFGPDVAHALFGLAVSTLLGAVCAGAGADRPAAAVGAALGAGAGALLATTPWPWLALGPFGAGLVGEHALVLLPLTAFVSGLPRLMPARATRRAPVDR